MNKEYNRMKQQDLFNKVFGTLCISLMQKIFGISSATHQEGGFMLVNPYYCTHQTQTGTLVICAEHFMHLTYVADVTD